MKLIFISLVGLASLALAAPLHMVSRQETPEQATDRLLFSTNIDDFVAAREASDPSTLDFTSDSCTSSPDNPLGFNFDAACQRHDFGYTNYRAQNRFTEENKARIDENFSTDLDNECETETLTAVCKGLADIYVKAVQELGGDDATRKKRTVLGRVEREAQKTQ